MNKWIGLTVLMAAIFGCNQKPINEARVDSFDRWCKARARIFCGMAEQNLKAGRLDDARDKADQAVELAPKFVEARMVLARIRMEQEAYVSAITELREAAKLDEESAEARYLLGVALEKSGQISDAVDAYEESYELDKSNVHAIMAIGEMLAVNGLPDEGSRYIEDYLPECKATPALVELAGRLAMSAKQYELAAKHYAALTRRNGDNSHWQEELARALFAGGRYAEASKAIEARTTIKDSQSPAWVYAMLGDCYTAASRMHRAKAAYAKALAIKPKNPELMVKAAQACLAVGQTDQAGVIARQALKIAPGGLEATLVLGYSLYRDKKPEKAQQILGPAVMLHPRSVTLLCLLGRCHAASGDNNQARECYRAAVDVDPDCEVARKLFAQCDEQEVSSNTAG